MIEAPAKNETSKPEVSWTDEDFLPLIQTFLTVNNNGETVEPSIQGISMVKRQDVPYVLIDMNYLFTQPIDSFENRIQFLF